jgi:SAM-dependent methyltransferase
MSRDIRDRKTELYYKIDQVAEEYEEIRFKRKSGQLNDHLQKEAVTFFVNSEELKGKAVLDIGCGTGRFSRVFSGFGARVVGIDLSRTMLLQAKGQGSAGAYLEGSALRLPFKDNAFDLAVSVNVFNHLSSYEQAVDEMCRVSRKVILGLPNRHSLLLLAYPYKVLRGWGVEDSGFARERYKTHPFPYSRYFSFGETKRILERNHFANIRLRGAWVIPLLPGWAVSLGRMMNKIMSWLLGRYGTFMAITGEKP